MSVYSRMDIATTAAAVRSAKYAAVEIVSSALECIRARNHELCAATRLLDERALASARRIDADVAAGRDPGPLAGVPFGVKDLFDVAGLPTTAGSAILSDGPAAQSDAIAVQKLCQAGAVLVATLNMDEFAYGFATVNSHYGTTRNPHSLDRLAGGSSGGSAAIVASGILPLALGSDTNGSIRVPASLCGIFGLKPTHGSLSIEGVYPFVETLDDIGPFCRSVRDLQLAYEILSGRPVERIAASMRVGRLTGYFEEGVEPELLKGIDTISDYLGGIPDITLAAVECARSAAYIITAAEGGKRHLEELRRRPLSFDPAIRDRLMAGALMPPPDYHNALRFRAIFRQQLDAVFENFDILLAPAAPQMAPLVNDPTIQVGASRYAARTHLGMLSQPLSFPGLPVMAAPLMRPGRLPLGLQIAAAPGNEALLFAFAGLLEDAGLLGYSPPAAYGQS